MYAFTESQNVLTKYACIFILICEKHHQLTNNKYTIYDKHAQNYTKYARIAFANGTPYRSTYFQ